jgi:hypothetical protein
MPRQRPLAIGPRRLAAVALSTTFERMLYPRVVTAATLPLYGLASIGQ